MQGNELVLDLSITPLNFERAIRQVDSLEKVIKSKVTAAGLRAIAKPLKADLAASLPVQTGALRDSIGYKKINKARSGAMGMAGDTAYEVGATRKSGGRYQTYKLRFLSYGTKPHRIKSKSGGALSFGGGFAQSVDHPGITGKNYVKKVYDKHQGHMQKLFVTGAHAVLQKHGVVVL